MPNTFSCVILDDDQFSRETLNDFFRSHDKIKVLKSLGDSRMAIRHLATLKPDMLFLDINMPNKTGLDIQNEINELNLGTEIVFITAYEEHVIEAFKNKAFDYLIKPINKVDFDDSVNRLIEKLSSNKKEKDSNSLEISKKQTNINDNYGKILIRNSYTSLMLKQENIIYIQADGGYTNIYLVTGKTEVLSKNIGKFQSYFSESPFYRISRGSIVNIQYVTKIDRLRSEVSLSVNERNVVLKASKERLLDMEVFISKQKILAFKR